MPVIESLLRVPDAAKLAKLSERTFWKLIADERTPAVIRIGRAVRLRASDVDLWLRLGCPDRLTFELERDGFPDAGDVAIPPVAAHQEHSGG